MTDTNELTLVAKQAGLEQSKVETLMQNFSGYFIEAKKIAKESKEIMVSDESQVDQMQKAREFRLKLKELRVKAEKTKIELKEQSLREGNAIQGVFNIIKALIIPVEGYLEKQEKFAEIKEAERRASLLNERTEELSMYVSDVSLYNLESMSDEVFANLLAGCKMNWEKARKEYAQAEVERLKKEKDDAEKQKMIKAENERLKKEIEDRVKKQAEDNRIAQEKLNKEREAREKIEAKLRAERKAQEEKEADLRRTEEIKKRNEEEKARKLLLAPDKEKLINLATVIDKLSFPNVSSREAGLVLEKTKTMLSNTSSFLIEKAKSL